jgi:putative two-component system response regulator
MAKAKHPAAVVSDINMPVMDGYVMCRAIRGEESLKDIPVMLLTMLSDPRDVIRGLNAGADAYLTKPYNIPSLVSRIAALQAYPPIPPPPVERRKVQVRLEGETYLVDAHGPRILNLLISTYENAVLQNRELTATQQALSDLNEHLEQRVSDQTAALALRIKEHAEIQIRLESERRENAEQRQEVYLSTIQAISMTLEKRDAYTSGHQRRATELAVAIAGEIGLAPERIEGLRVSGLLYDLGKVSVPADILNRTRPLNKSEFALVKAHVQSGCEIVQGIKFPWPVAQIVLQHHERLDGSGYPAGLKNGEIGRAHV